LIARGFSFLAEYFRTFYFHQFFNSLLCKSSRNSLGLKQNTYRANLNSKNHNGKTVAKAIIPNENSFLVT